MFTKKERSTFPYWFAHWCAFNMTALNCHAWKFKYLFHDFEKPWLRLFMPYKKVQKWHRRHNKHHIQWADYHDNRYDKLDWEAMMIDWECSRFTKQGCPLNAAQELRKEFHETFEKDFVKAMALKCYGTNTLIKLGLDHQKEMNKMILEDLEKVIK